MRRFGNPATARCRTRLLLPLVDLAIPAFDYQNHTSIDRGFGFIRQWSPTVDARYEGPPCAWEASRQNQCAERRLG
jgi:hypothetical protein